MGVGASSNDAADDSASDSAMSTPGKDSEDSKKSHAEKELAKTEADNVSPSMLSPTISHDKLKGCLKSKGLVVADKDIQEILMTKVNTVDALASLIDSGKARKMIKPQRGRPDTKAIKGLRPPGSISPPPAAPVQKRGRSGEPLSNGDCAVAKDMNRETPTKSPARGKARTVMPTATVVDKGLKPGSAERPPKRLNATDRSLHDTDRPLMKVSSGGTFFGGSAGRQAYASVQFDRMITGEVFAEDNRPTEAFVLRPMQLGSPPRRLSSTPERPTKSSPLKPNHASPEARPFPKLLGHLDMAQLEHRARGAASSWKQKSLEEREYLVRGVRNALRLPELDAMRQERLEEELSRLITSALDDLATLGTPHHGAQLFSNAIRKVRISIHETSQTVAGRYIELYAKNQNSSDETSINSTSTDSLDSSRDSRSGGGSPIGRGVWGALVSRGRAKNLAKDDEPVDLLSFSDENPSMLSPDRTVKGFGASRIGGGLSATDFVPQTPMSSGKSRATRAAPNFTVSFEASPRSVKAGTSAAATELTIGSWSGKVKQKAGQSSRFMAVGRGIPASSAQSAEKPAPIPPDEKAFWDSLKICKEALKRAKHDRKEAEWLRHQIGRVQQVAEEQIKECAAELKTHQEEVSRLEGERRRTEERMETLTKEVIHAYLKPSTSKEDSLRALLSNIQQGSNMEEHNNLCRRQHALKEHTSITQKFNAKGADLLILQHANDVNMVLIKELHGDVIEILSGLDVNAGHKRTRHQTGLKATAREVLGKMVGAITFHIARKRKAEEKLEKGLRQLKDEGHFFGDDYVIQDSEIPKERLQKLRFFAQDSTAKIAKIKGTAETVHAALQMDLSEEDLADLADATKQAFASSAALAAAAVGGSNPDRLQYVPEALGIRIDEPECAVM